MRNFFFYLFFCTAISASFFYFIHSKDKPFIQIPLHKEEISGFYYVDIDIEKMKIPHLVDTGMSTTISLSPKIIEKIQSKKKIGSSTWFDVKGNRYQNPYYEVELMKMGEIHLGGVSVREEKRTFLEEKMQISIEGDNYSQIEKKVHLYPVMKQGILD